jgi:hypothetical protein
MARYRDIDSSHEMRESATSAAAEVICKACKEIIMSVPEFTRDFNIRHSMAYELQEWLHSFNMSQIMTIFARHGISSVSMVSSLNFSDDCISRIAEELSAASSQSYIQSLANVTLIVQRAQESELNKAPSWRCERFLDSEASAMTAMFSTSAVDIMLTKKYFLLLILLCSGGMWVLCLFAWVSHTFFPESYLTSALWSNPLELMILSISSVSLGIWPVFLGGNYENIPRNRFFKPRRLLSWSIVLLFLAQTIVLMLNKSLPFDSFSFGNSHLCEAAREKNWLRTSMNFCVFYELVAIYGLQYLGFLIWFITLNFYQKYFLRSFVVSACSMCTVDMIMYRCITVAHVQNSDFSFASQMLSAIPSIISVALLCLLICFEVLHFMNSRKARQKLKEDTEEYEHPCLPFFFE